MNRHIRKRKILKRRIAVVMACICMFAAIGILGSMVLTDAKAETDNHETVYKYYKSIEIKSGDTLWSIANEYKSEDCTTQEYISEVKSLNGLSTDDIQDSHHLMIMYYDTEYR